MYYLTRLGFGINCAPRIMMRILREVLAQDERIREATSHYIDDIIVNEDIVGAEDVVLYLASYGLVTKPVEGLVDNRVLGLKIIKNKEGKLEFRRGGELPDLKEGNLSRREVFSICGKLVGHYPVVGWLRVATSYLKRHVEGKSWNDLVDDKVIRVLKEMLEEVKERDPVKGFWRVSDEDKGVVWCDASNLAIGAALEIGGKIVEDGSWIRKKNDVGHINVAELEAVIRGVNLALKWGLKELEIKTDSMTVVNWLGSAITMERRVKTRSSAEMLIKRRLGVLSQLIIEFGLSVSVKFVRSEMNKADSLTRVRKSWMGIFEEGEQREEEIAAVANIEKEVKDLHEKHHFGVNRTLYLTKMVVPEATRKVVEKCVKDCKACQSIDPAPVRFGKGELGVSRNWLRVAIDVTHYKGKHYLSLVDCGPSRLAIWKVLNNETAREIIRKLEEVLVERGPMKQLMMDNGTAFRSTDVERLCKKWNIERVFRAANRASGNAIVERLSLIHISEPTRLLSISYAVFCL